MWIRHDIAALQRFARAFTVFVNEAGTPAECRMRHDVGDSAQIVVLRVLPDGGPADAVLVVEASIDAPLTTLSIGWLVGQEEAPSFVDEVPLDEAVALVAALFPSEEDITRWLIGHAAHHCDDRGQIQVAALVEAWDQACMGGAKIIRSKSHPVWRLGESLGAVWRVDAGSS